MHLDSSRRRRVHFVAALGPIQCHLTAYQAAAGLKSEKRNGRVCY